MGHLRVTICHLRVTIGHLRVTIGHLRIIMSHLRLTIGYLQANVVHIRSTQGNYRSFYVDYRSPQDHYRLQVITELHPKVRQTSIIMAYITWAGPRCVQEPATILGPQNCNQGHCAEHVSKSQNHPKFTSWECFGILLAEKLTKTKVLKIIAPSVQCMYIPS